MTRLTVLPFLLAMFAAVAAMPTNVYQICAWDVGTLALDPWRRRSTAAVRRVAQGIRAWLASIWTPRFAFACLAALLAIMLAHGATVGVVMAIVPLGAPAIQAKQAQRSRLLREAEALKAADGSFANDAARASFDAKMSEIDAIDIELRGQSQFIVERNPLDPGAPTGGQNRLTMAQEETQEPNERDRGAQQERERVQGIHIAVRAARLPSSFADKLIADGKSLLECQRAVFEEMGRREPAPETRSQVSVDVGPDPMVHVRAGIQNAILHRLSPDHFKLEDVGRNYRAMTMLDIARCYLQARGVRTTDMTKNQLAGAALNLNEVRTVGYHTTSDFTLLLADVANKTLRRAYEEQPQTFAPLGRRVTIPDYKPVRRLQIGEAPALLEVKEHGEYQHGTIGEGKEQYQLVKYGRKFAITREALINDDTDAFSRIPMGFGRKARTLESDKAWAQITSNPNMGDGNALFSAAHGNDLMAAVVGIDSLGDARAALRNQTGIDGELLNLSARYLAVPPSLETLADQLTTQITPQLVGSVNPFGPGGRTPLTVIVEPRLENFSQEAWFIAASPDQIDMLEFGYLEGEEGPQVESRVGFDVDGLEIKCRLDFVAKVIDWRGFVRNLGGS